MIRLPDAALEEILDAYRYDVSPVSDDAPFFWHFTRFRDVIAGDWFDRNQIDPEDGHGEQTLLLMLAVSSGFAVAFLLLPFLLVRERWRALPHKAESAAYFAALGLGFMCLEIPLIQKLTLFLGYPTYTLSVTLFALLVFSGIGSLASGLYAERRDRALAVLLAALAAFTLFLQLGFDGAMEALIGLPLALRIAAAVALLAPLGLVLGAFLPLGITSVARLSPHAGEYVAWSWAVNGVFSVMGSMLATILSMSYGFRAVMLLAVGIYAIGAVALRAIPLAASAPPSAS